MFANIALLLAALIVALLAYAATRPGSFSISRSTLIAASPATLFPLINDLRANERWSPWKDLDPAMQVTYSANSIGPGARYDWQGNSKAGSGHITITQSVPDRSVAMDLEMLKPMKASNKVTFDIVPEGTGTRVTWTMAGAQPYLGKLMTIFIDCDAMVGKQFETGLSRLKALAEG